MLFPEYLKDSRELTCNHVNFEELCVVNAILVSLEEPSGEEVRDLIKIVPSWCPWSFLSNLPFLFIPEGIIPSPVI